MSSEVSCPELWQNSRWHNLTLWASVPSSESCQKPYLLPALMKEPCRFIRYTSLKSHGKFQIRLCSSNATRKILWCQDSAIGGCPSFSRQVNTLLCMSGNLQDCIGVVLEGLRTPLTFPVEVPWSSHTFLCRERGRAKCIAASVSTLMLYLRGGPASAGPPSGPSGPSEHGKKSRLRGESEAWAWLNRNHSVSFTAAELCQVVFSGRFTIWF